MQNKQSYTLKEISMIFDPSYHKAVAFIDEQEKVQITYAHLWNKVYQQSQRIDQTVQKKEAKILLFLESGFSFVIAFYAILYSGHIPILVNSKLKEELSQLNSLFDYVLTDDSLKSKLTGFLNISSYSIIQTAKEEITNNIPPVLNRNIEADKTFLFLYTSGSTGEPKLVNKSLINIMIEIGYLKELLSLTDNDIILPLVPSFHIYGLLFTVILPLNIGCQIRRDIPYSPLNIIEEGIINGATIVVGNPSIYSAMMNSLKQFEAESFSHLKYFISSTMPIDQDIVQKLYKDRNIKILELYGSTETGGIAFRKLYENKFWTLFPYVKSAVESDNKVLKLSSPTIYQSSNRDHSIDEWYNTGDIIEQGTSEKEFLLLGRVNQIVKVGGNRVSSIEVEKVIQSSSLVEKAVVIGVASKGLDGEKLVAYVQLADQNDKHVLPHLKSYCKERLAEFKLPKHFVIVDLIPLGANNKVLFNQLPKVKS